MPTITDEIKASFRNGTAVVKLIYINLAVFIVVKLFYVFLVLFGAPDLADSFLSYLMLPASLEKLLHRPWGVISYMFLHFDFLHILFNLIWFFWFGRIFLRYLNEKQLIATYLLGGIFGAALFILSYNVLPGLIVHMPMAEALGASASVTAIIIAISFYAPNYTVNLIFIGPVKIKYIAIFFIITDLLQIASENAGGHIAHLGGAIYGYLFAMRLKQGKDVGKFLNNFFDFIVNLFKRQPKMKVSYRNNTKGMDDMEYNKTKAEAQKEIDRILDKIAKSGYDSLTKKEKETLFKMSK
ncbi:MAG: rhomboid family intramembrane serine protease [Bacteroidales bacterium]|nr:rhomboid family intramembrane serine protease [Bacteroidales bacterium]